MKHIVIDLPSTVLAWIVLGSVAYSQPTTTIKGEINVFASVRGFGKACEATSEPGTMELLLDNANPFVTSDVNLQEILIIQMKGRSIVRTDNANYGTKATDDDGLAGQCELNKIKSIDRNTIHLMQPLEHTYDTADIVQIVRVPRYPDGVIIDAAGLTTCPWNGRYGGVIALDVRREGSGSAAVLWLNGHVNASGKGFRGGMASETRTWGSLPWTGYVCPLESGNAGQKGEGVAHYYALEESGKTPLANGGGGGGYRQAGGGGGANAGNGGLGGEEVIFRTGVGQGMGGIAQVEISPTNPEIKNLFLGGGGGGGSQSYQLGSRGGRGGGIILIWADEIVGNGKKMLANGYTSEHAGEDPPTQNADGAGGGGSGGSIALVCSTYSNAGNLSPSLTLETKGGNGGNVNSSNNATYCGPGGGGGGGLVVTSVTLPTHVSTVVTYGSTGTPLANSGATPGDNGIVTTTVTIPRYDD